MSPKQATMRINTERRIPYVCGLLLLIGGLAALAKSTRYHLSLADESTVAPSVIQSMAAGVGTLWLELIVFSVSFVALHLFAGWATGYLGVSLGKLAGWREAARLRFAWFLFILFATWLWLQNAASFSHSLFSWPEEAGTTAASTSIAALGYLLALTLGIGFAQRIKTLLAQWPRKIRIGTLAGAAALFIASMAFALRDDGEFMSGDADKPNVIVVGIDGWRLNTLSTHGGDPQIMPHMEALLKDAVIFEEGLTSLARSYPSWWSVLSGKYPINHGARFNLIDHRQISSSAHLTRALGDLGYYRLFAMDERRFANIDTTHGFDRIVGPETGAADFLLGTIADTPLTNLVVNTWLGAKLFPHIHGNRAAFVTYRPETFTRQLTTALREIPDKPLFLAVHHELPHWPYHWAEGPTGKYEELTEEPQFADYLETLHHADRQVHALLNALAAIGALDNSLLIIMSDHGEAFRTDLSSYHDPRMTFGWPDPGIPYELPKSAELAGSLESYPGHGTHILSLEQHRIPIIIKDFTAPFEPGVHPGRATLADLYPTIVDRLGVEPADDMDGISLLPFLRKRDPLPARPIPLETGFTSQLLLTGELDVAALMMESIAYYQVNADGSLVLKPETVDQLINCKQIGVLFADRIHAVIGQNRRTAVEMRLADGAIVELSPKDLGANMESTSSIHPPALLRNALLAAPCRT